LFVPSQVSATSQVPALARHSVVLGSTASVGQLTFTPSQDSGASHRSVAERHTVVDGSMFVWQTPALSQVSASSQSVSELLPQAVPLASKASAGQAPAPSHFSSTSHSPASERHVTVFGSLFT
jgi:hypothetical protein